MQILMIKRNLLPYLEFLQKTIKNKGIISNNHDFQNNKNILQIKIKYHKKINSKTILLKINLQMEKQTNLSMNLILKQIACKIMKE